MALEVGPGALSELQRCLRAQGGKTPQELLKHLHEWIKPQLLEALVHSVCGERGWTPTETEHCLCEHRKYTFQALKERAHNGMQLESDVAKRNAGKGSKRFGKF